MKLIDIVGRLDEFDEELTIYLKEPWACDSEVLLVREPDDGSVPQEAMSAGMSYFLEVFIARDFIVDWISNTSTLLTESEKCDRLMHFARFDS